MVIMAVRKFKRDIIQAGKEGLERFKCSMNTVSRKSVAETLKGAQKMF